MATSAVQHEADGAPRHGRPSLRTLGVGAMAGVVAGLVLTLLQALARLWVGVAPPSELIGDRLAPLLPVDFFLQLRLAVGARLRRPDAVPDRRAGFRPAADGPVHVARHGGLRGGLDRSDREPCPAGAFPA